MISRTRDAATTQPEIGTARRWAMLAAGTGAQAASAVMIHGPAFLIPTLHRQLGFSLAEAGLVAAAPTVGVMLTLVGWGLFVDARGERLALLLGLVGATVFGVAAVLAHDHVLLLAVLLGLAGAAAASTNAASGRLVVGWFPPQRRGLAMGIRQMAQPIGVGIGAIGIAVLAEDRGIGVAILLPTVLCAIGALAVAAFVVDPARPTRTTEPVANPYRADGFLSRIHGVSVLLVVPQFLVWTFALVWLVQDRGWSTGAAGALVAVAQVAGALGRIGVGQLSDVVGSRTTVLRWVTYAAVLTMLLLGVTAGLEWSVSVVLVVVATMVTVADNGLAFTAVAERAGPFWSGRALGVQNTAQFLTASAVPPVAGLAVTAWGFPAAFAIAALFPLVAVPLVPVRAEAELR